MKLRSSIQTSGTQNREPMLSRKYARETSLPMYLDDVSISHYEITDEGRIGVEDCRDAIVLLPAP